jgi:oxygen-independent coproporphyrinogen-3 oxidase
MFKDDCDKRNFLFFLNEVHPVCIDDALIAALAKPSSWDDVAGTVKTARQKDIFARSINRVQLYVHVPFCEQICKFCNCSKQLLQRTSDIDEYIEALTRQMMFFAPIYKDMDASIIVFGGGTPSILNEKQQEVILDGVDKAFPARNRKIFFEIHPSSWTAPKLEALASRGLYRLSIGVQSLDGKVLKEVFRSQTRKQILWCLRSARKIGVPHVNVDLIAGLPGQTVEGLIEDLKVVIAEGANIIDVQPYSGPSLKALCGSGETFLEFIKRRDVMMNAVTEILFESGFRRKGIWESYSLNGEGGYGANYKEKSYGCLEEAVAGFGPYARGFFPGAIFYRSGRLKFGANLTEVNAVTQDSDYAMVHYAVLAIIKDNGLDEQIFFQRFGVPLDQLCGEGLRYLQQSGLVAFCKGVWKFSGKWEIRRIREYFAFSRVLFRESLLLRLRVHYLKTYNPGKDYSGGDSFFKSYAEHSLLSVYYRV